MRYDGPDGIFEDFEYMDTLEALSKVKPAGLNLLLPLVGKSTREIIRDKIRSMSMPNPEPIDQEDTP